MNRHKAKTFKLNLDTGRLTMDQVGQARLSLHQGSDIAQDALPKGGLNEALGLDRLLAASDAAANKPQAPKPLDPYTEVLGKEPKK